MWGRGGSQGPRWRGTGPWKVARHVADAVVPTVGGYLA